MTASARGTVSGPTLPDDAPLEEKVAFLVRRVQSVELQADADRQHTDAQVKAIRGVVDGVSNQLREAALAVETKAKSMVLDTIRLQLAGLLLVGIGTILLALAALVAA